MDPANKLHQSESNHLRIVQLELPVPDNNAKTTIEKSLVSNIQDVIFVAPFYDELHFANYE